MQSWLTYFLRMVFGFSALLFGGIATLVFYLNSQLPSVETLAKVQLQVPLRIYTADQKLIAEFGEKRRSPIRIDKVPKRLIQAILATEDRRFYEHSGVDLRGLLRAASHLLLHGNRDQGGSTITMQVARNFFLSSEKTFTRKFNEILLAFKIEQELSKDLILELYLNKIYFGKRAYGVVAASEVYYGLPLERLNLAQIAMIAGLPQAPSTINPLHNPEAALKRRYHVLDRMLEYGFISDAEFREANQSPILTSYHERPIEAYAPHVAEMVRQELVAQYGEETYTSGYVVTTTLDSRLQAAAVQSLRSGLHEYDQRHGYRGPIARLSQEQRAKPEQWGKILSTYPAVGELLLAVVHKVKENAIHVTLANNRQVEVTWPDLQWARSAEKEGKVGPPLKHPHDILSVGDVLYLEQHSGNRYRLSQAPDANAALLSLAGKDGAILSLVGGYEFQKSHFNRATQAFRQPGSSFKPFIYCAALLEGLTAASIVNDAPIIVDDPLQENWRPQNDNQKFHGPTRLRVGISKSRNLVSIRLLQHVGLDRALEIFSQFGFSHIVKGLSLALGTSETTVLGMARGFAVFANGGYLVSPYLIQKIEDAAGTIVYKTTPTVACTTCFSEQKAPRIIPETTSYIMTSMLQDAIKVGTAQRALSLHRQDIAGKTGTTQHQMDAWYVGYNPHIVTAVWMGFDEPRSLYEYGAQAALPLWIKFMDTALKGTLDLPFTEPNGLVYRHIDPLTGLLARPEQKNAVQEMFAENTEPTRTAPSANSFGQSTKEKAQNGTALGAEITESVDPEALF